MNPSTRKRASYGLLIILIIALNGRGQAMEAPPLWFSHAFGGVSIYAELTVDEEPTLLMDGTLRFAYPDGFQIQYHTLGGPIMITSQDGFVEVQTQGDIQYGYDSYWLFEDIQTYLFGLTEFSTLSLEFSGMDRVAERSVKRYKAPARPGLVLWFDEESGLPLLIREGKETLVKVTSYTLHVEEPKPMTTLELELKFAQEPATVILSHGEEGWSFSRLIINEVLGQVEMEFTDWFFAPEWIQSPLPKLTKLRELNERFLIEFELTDWKNALATSQEMISLAPQFWQAYLFQAFTYEGLDNFLGVVENYQQVLMREPNHHLALNNLAYHYFLREVQIPQALEMAERAVALERKDVYLDTLGYGYYLVGRFEEAEALLLEALETAPAEAVHEITAHLNLVRAALDKGE